MYNVCHKLYDCTSLYVYNQINNIRSNVLVLRCQTWTKHK